MCGIFAYLNYNVPRERRYIFEVLFNGLRRLEYRGYDSSGIALDADLPSSSSSAPYAGLSPLVFRQEGKIENLVRSVYAEVDEKDVNLDSAFSAHAGIAHTRWATHGVPAPRNSHPQSSGAGDEFLVVHNGIITNYEAWFIRTPSDGGHIAALATDLPSKQSGFVYCRSFAASMVAGCISGGGPDNT